MARSFFRLVLAVSGGAEITSAFRPGKTTGAAARAPRSPQEVGNKKTAVLAQTHDLQKNADVSKKLRQEPTEPAAESQAAEPSAASQAEEPPAPEPVPEPKEPVTLEEALKKKERVGLAAPVVEGSPVEPTPDEPQAAAPAPRIIERPTSLPPERPGPDPASIAKHVDPNAPVKSAPAVEEAVVDADTGTSTKIDGVQQYVMHEAPGFEGVHPAWTEAPKPTEEPTLLNSPTVDGFVTKKDDPDMADNDTIRQHTMPAPGFVASKPNQIFFQIAFGITFLGFLLALWGGLGYFVSPASMLVKQGRA